MKSSYAASAPARRVGKHGAPAGPFKGKEDGNYAHPTDPTKFISCVQQDAYEQYCPCSRRASADFEGALWEFVACFAGRRFGP